MSRFPARSLAGHQAWLVDGIIATAAPRGIDQVLGASTVPPRIGLGVYRHAYLARLEEVLADDFPVLRAVLGPRASSTLLRRIIRERPSPEATLNRYGRRVPAWLRTRERAEPDGRGPGGRPWSLLVDAARLDWALVEAVHEPLAAALDPAALAGIAPDAWAQVRLVPAPSLRLFPVRHQVGEAHRQLVAGGVDDHGRVDRPAVGPGLIAVVRTAEGVFQRTWPRADGALLRDLVQGLPLAQALARTVAGPVSRRLDAARIQGDLAGWIQSGYIAGLRLT